MGRLAIRKLDNRPYWKVYDKKTGLIYCYAYSKEEAKMRAKYMQVSNDF